MRAYNVVIIGGRQECVTIMDLITMDRLRQLQMRLVGVADTDPLAPGVKKAESLGIFTTNDYRDLLGIQRLDMIIDLTGKEEINQAIQRNKPPRVQLINHAVARLFWDFLSLEEERYHVEKDLKKSQNKYKHLFDNAREGLALFNKQGVIIECNFSLARMLGYSKEELEQKKVSDLCIKLSEELLKCNGRKMDKFAFTGIEMDFIRKDGSLLPVELDSTWFSDEKLYQVMLKDITFKKRLEDARKNYSKRLKKEVAKRTGELIASEKEMVKQRRTAEGIIHGSPIPMMVLDNDHKIIYWNKACEELTGCHSQDMIGTDRQWAPFYPKKRPVLSDLVVDDDKEAIKYLYKNMHLKKSPFIEGAYEAEHFFKHLGETGTHIHIHVTPIRDEKGGVQGAIVTFQDISERVKMLQEIKQREDFVQNLIQNSIDGIVAINERGEIEICNPGVGKILGYDPAEIAGKMSYQDILSEQTASPIKKAFYADEFGPHGKIVNMEAKVPNKNKELIPVRFSGTLLYENEKEIGSVLFIQDLRQIQQLQKEKRQAQRMAAIGRTVAGLAHYIKNILTGLQGASYLVKSGTTKVDPVLIEKGLSMMDKNIIQINQIVKDMLIYSADKSPDYQSVDPVCLMKEVIELMSERAKLTGVMINFDHESYVGEVKINKMAMHHCLLNILSNAIDACTLKGILDGQGQVNICVDRPDGWAVRFLISDNGIGMNKKIQNKLFTDFFTTKGYKGTGLGLPVTKKIVHDHGGELTFQSKEGSGTTFFITLPFNKN